MLTRFNESIWGDEGFSAILSMKSLPNIIKIIATDTSPPLWNIWEWLFFRLFGTNEIVIRSLAFIFFLGTVFFTYKIGELLWNKKTGLIAAILTFLNPFFFIYAFEGRMYSILALGVTASMYFFLKIVRNPKEKPLLNKAGYVIATLWALYSHHFSIFALILQGFWFIKEFIFGDKKVAISLFKTFIVIGVGYLPWMIPLYNQTKMVGGGFWLGTPNIKDFLGLLGKYLGAGIDHPLRKYALGIFLLVILTKKWRFNEKNLFLVSWFIFPVLATWVISQFFQSIFFDRYLLYAIPGAMLVVSSNPRKITYFLLSVLIVILIIVDFHYFTHPTKRPFRKLSNYVKSTRQEGDYLINWNAASHHIWETKFYGIGAPIYIPGEGELPFFVGTALMEEGDIIHELPENINRVGVVTSGPIDEITLSDYAEEEAKIFKASPEGADIKFIWFASVPKVLK